MAGALQARLDAIESEEPVREAFATDEVFRRAHAAWDARFEEVYDAQEAGAVFLSDQGCGYTSLLVTTGPHRGAVWADLRPGDGGIEPTGHDFAHWYRSWLERTERRLEVTPFPSTRLTDPSEGDVPVS